MELFKELPVLLFASQAEWSKWLEENQAKVSGVWLKHAKKASGKTSVSYAEALDVALCYGWIDSQKQAYDAEYFLQKFTPRGPKSVWSKVNVAKVEALITAGKMRPAGLAAVERAKQDGRWDAAYDAQSTSKVLKIFRLRWIKIKLPNSFSRPSIKLTCTLFAGAFKLPRSQKLEAPESKNLSVC